MIFALNFSYFFKKTSMNLSPFNLKIGNSFMKIVMISSATDIPEIETEQFTKEGEATVRQGCGLHSIVS
jgi:hypothetical protein